jgi:hypothetical protein
MLLLGVCSWERLVDGILLSESCCLFGECDGEASECLDLARPEIHIFTKIRGNESEYGPCYLQYHLQKPQRMRRDRTNISPCSARDKPLFVEYILEMAVRLITEAMGIEQLFRYAASKLTMRRACRIRLPGRSRSKHHRL